MEYIKLRKMMVFFVLSVTLIIASLIIALGRNLETIPTQSDIVETDGINKDFEPQERDDTWDETSSSTITLNGTSAELSGDGLSINENIITITKAGVYVLSGSSEDIQIVVSVNNDTDLVKLVLNGVSMTHSSSAPIYIKSADKTIVTLAKGSFNSLEDHAGDLVDKGEDEPNGTLFSKDDLVINGSGILEITAHFNHAIVSKDNLKIVGGTFIIKSKNDAIKGKDSVTILDGDFTIESEGDAIQSNNSTDTNKGTIVIHNGTFKIQSYGDGLDAETSLTILNGNFDITTLENTSGSSNKGIKSKGILLIEQGQFTLDTFDDAIHSNHDVTINDGNVVITSLDDGVHSDGNLIINGGSIEILGSYEGLEGSNVTINGGEISLYAVDDGINAAGGTDVQSDDTKHPDQFQDAQSHAITINGGSIRINAEGDGLDSNGDIMINGGLILVYGPMSDGDASIDCDGAFQMNGGSLIASGSSGMVNLPDSASTQVSLTLFFNEKKAKNTSITIEAQNNDVVLAFDAEKQFQSITLSDAQLKLGEVYEVYEDGSLLFEIELTEQVTSVDNNGTALRVMQDGPSHAQNDGRPGNGGPSQRP